MAGISPSLIRLKIFKKIVPRRFLVTFGHRNTLQKELNCFVVGKSWTWLPLILTAPFITQKKIRSVYKVHGTQNNRLELTVSTQQSVLKNLHRVPRYWQKHPKLCRFGLATWFLGRFAKYLGTRCIFLKPDFCVETLTLRRLIWIPWTL